MPRPPRLDLPGVAQHIVQRGNDRQSCFFTVDDYRRCLRDQSEIARQEGCAIHAYVLTTNHVHLLVTPPDVGCVGRMMQALGRRYVRYINQAHHRTATLWESRCKACLVDSDAHLLRCHRCIELDPVRAAMLADLRDYPWSSHQHNAFGEHDLLVHPHAVYRELAAQSKRRRARSQAFVSERQGVFHSLWRWPRVCRSGRQSRPNFRYDGSFVAAGFRHPHHNKGIRAMRKRFVLIVLALVGLALATSGWGATFTFGTGLPDGRMASASQPSGSGVVEIESADDFVLSSQTTITSASFYGLLPTTSPSVSYVGIEIYRVFPQDSTNPPSGNVPTRANSPSDVAFAARDSMSGNLTFSTTLLGSFSVQNTVGAGGIHKLPNQTTGGNGAASGNETRFDVTFTTPLVLPAGHYFFVPQVALSAGSFLWLSSPKPIVAPGTPFSTDLQSWIRDADLAPDWLRVGTDIVGGATPPTFNAAFSLSGTAVTVIAVTPATITAQEGVSFSGPVASFTDSDSSQTSAANFTATIDWGDGTTSAGTITSGATFGVTGTHTYADEGNFTVTITVTDSASQTGSATGAANVGESDVLSGTPLAISATQFVLFSGPVANFSDTYTGNPASDFVATIQWGDGQTTAGTVSGGGGAFTVSGSHTYFSAGTFSVTTTLADDTPGTATATVTSTATVTAAPPVGPAPTLSALGLLALAIALGAGGLRSLRSRN